MNPRIAIDVSCKLPKRFNAKRLIPFSTFLLLFCFLVPSTRLLGQTFTSTGTWVCPVGVTSITVECWGGGGAGGGSVTVLAPNAGAGGGGGGYTKRTSVSVTPGNTYNVIVGQGGSGNVAFTVNGNNGGNSYFGTSTALAYGGNGGGGNGGSIGTGGIGSTWNGGDGALAKNSTTSGGGGGGAGYGSVGGNANQITPGSGGIGNSSGTGGAGFSSNANGNSGNIIAGGGSGAGQSGIIQSWTGGSGANGEVILTNTSPPTVTGISSNICVGGSITITGTNFAGITAANVKIGATAVSSITSSTSTQIVAVVATACTGTVSVTTSGGTATSSATFTAYSYPAAPTVTTPINYCLNAVASQLTATGSNLTWGSGSLSGTAGGTTTLSTLTYIDGAFSNKKTNFTTTAANVKIISINYYIPAWQSVSNLVLALYNSSGTVIATSSTSTTLTNGGSPVTITNIFNYTIASAGNYSIGISTGTGTIGGDSPSFPITEATGTINVTGTTNPGSTPYHCFNNIQFSVNNGSIAPTPSTSVAGTTNYLVSQTVSGCVSPQATIAVIVNNLPSATISYSGTPYCISLGTAQNVTLTGTSGGTYSASPSGLSINSSTGAITPSTSTPGTYTVTYTIPPSGGCAVYTTTTSLTVSALSVGGSVGSNATVCSGTNSGTVNLTGQTGNVLNWQYSTDGGTTWTSIANTTTSQTFTNLTQTTSGRAVVQNGGCSSANSNAATVTVNAVSVGGSVGSNATVCSGSNSGTLNLTGQTGSVVNWQYSTDSGTTWTSIANTTTSQTYSNLTQTTLYKAVVQSGVCSSANSSAAIITVNAASVGGSVGSNATVCSGTNSGILNLTGQTGSIINWQYSTNGGTTWTTIANTTTSQTYTNLTQTTLYRAVVQNGVCSSAFSSSATITVNAIPAAPTVTTPINYCLNAVASQLTATGSNLTWGSGSISGSVGGTSILSTVVYIDNNYNNKKTNFTTTVPNVTISNIDYYIPSYQAVSGMVLAIYNSSGAVIATSSTTTTLTAGSSTVKISNSFSYTISTAGNYGVGVYAGSGNIGSDNPSFPITELTGTINITGVSVSGSRCFNNIQFTVNNGSIAPTPSTSTTGTTNYFVSQTVNGCVSPQATIAVIVGAPSSATISYSGTPFCKSVGTAQAVIQSGTSGGAYSASPSGLTINSSTGAITPSSSAAGTYTVTYTMAAAGGCSAQTATSSVTITTTPSATVSYSGSPFCINSGSVSVTQTGIAGGTYSSTSGLFINSSTGAINLNSSSAGTYTVTYTIAASGVVRFILLQQVSQSLLL